MLCIIFCGLQKYPDFEGEGGLKVVEEVKSEFDERWGPSWHCVMGKSFGSFVTHETQNFMYFYLGDKACMLFKAGPLIPKLYAHVDYTPHLFWLKMG